MAANKAADQKTRYDKRKAAGICTRCGRGNASKGKTTCDRCRNYNTTDAARRKSRREEGRQYTAELVADYLEQNPGSSCPKIAVAIGRTMSTVYWVLSQEVRFANPRKACWCLVKDAAPFRVAEVTKPKSDWAWWEHLNALIAEDYRNGVHS